MADDDTVYDFATPDAPKAVVPVVPRVVKLGYQSRPDEKIVREPTTDVETIKNLQMPGWLLGGGVVIEVVSQLLYERGRFGSALFDVGLQLGVGTVVLLVGILLAGKWRQFHLDPFWILVLKVAALAVAPSAAVDLVSPGLGLIPFGFVIGVLGEFVFYFALLGAMFDLDESDTWFCIWVIFLFRLGAFLVMRVCRY